MAPETVVKDVDIETDPIVNDGKVDMSTEDSETSEESSTEKTEDQGASGKDGKTTPEGPSPEEGQDDEVKDDGKPVPYERFKQVVDQRNLNKTELAALKAEQDEMEGFLNNPIVFRALLQSKGITDPKVLDAKMKEAGFEVTEPKEKSEIYKQFSQGLDLSKQDSWFEVMERMFKHFSKEALGPIERKLTEKERKEWVSVQESEAKKLAKNVYGLEYGVAGKDENNPNTAVGKIRAYLNVHPEHAYLGHVPLLKLALSEDTVKIGEQKGVKKEKDRHKELKSSAAEGDAQAGAEEKPSSEWSVSQLMAWRRKHGK